MDIYHYFSGDTSSDGVGGLLSADGVTESQQRIIRRVLTNPGDYIYDPSYGIGAGVYVGATTAELGGLKSRISNQILQEPSVSPSPAPEVTLKSDLGVLYISIKYMDVPSNTTQLLLFNTMGV